MGKMGSADDQKCNDNQSVVKNTQRKKLVKQKENEENAVIMSKALTPAGYLWFVV